MFRIFFAFVIALSSPSLAWAGDLSELDCRAILEITDLEENVGAINTSHLSEQKFLESVEKKHGVEAAELLQLVNEKPHQVEYLRIVSGKDKISSYLKKMQEIILREHQKGIKKSEAQKSSWSSADKLALFYLIMLGGPVMYHSIFYPEIGLAASFKAIYDVWALPAALSLLLGYLDDGLLGDDDDIEKRKKAFYTSPELPVSQAKTMQLETQAGVDKTHVYYGSGFVPRSIKVAPDKKIAFEKEMSMLVVLSHDANSGPFLLIARHQITGQTAGEGTDKPTDEATASSETP